MKVYILISNWMSFGDTEVNNIIAVYNNLKDVRQSLADCVNTDLQYHEYEHVWCNSETGRKAEDFNIHQLATMHSGQRTEPHAPGTS